MTVEEHEAWSVALAEALTVQRCFMTQTVMGRWDVEVIGQLRNYSELLHKILGIPFVDSMLGQPVECRLPDLPGKERAPISERPISRTTRVRRGCRVTKRR